MVNIEIGGRCKSEYKKLACFVAEQVIKYMKFPDGLEIAINFVSPNVIREINLEFRSVDRVTDVLSFPSFSIKAGEILDLNNKEVFKQDNGFVHFGDIAICLRQTETQAKEYGVDTKDEIKKLVIHSVLHLMGYDHIEDEDFALMNKYENLISKNLEATYGV